MPSLQPATSSSALKPLISWLPKHHLTCSSHDLLGPCHAVVPPHLLLSSPARISFHVVIPTFKTLVSFPAPPSPPLPPPPPPPRVCPIIHPDVPLSHAGTSECSTSNCQPPQLPRLLSVALPPDGQHGGGHGHHQHVPPPVHHQPAHARAAYRCRLAAGQRLHQGRAVQVDPMKPMLKAPGHML